MKTAASEAVLFIFQLPTMSGLRTGISIVVEGMKSATRRLRGSIRERSQARELFAFQQFQRSAATGRDERHVLRFAGSMHRQSRFPPAHDRQRVGVGNRVSHRKG